MIKFSDWLITAKESSPFTRLRWNAAMGLAPPIPDASIHSRSTATPWMVEKLTKKKKKKKKKKHEAAENIEEHKVTPVKHKEIDNWLGEVDKLKTALASLKDVIAKKKKEKPEEKKDEPKDEKKVVSKTEAKPNEEKEETSEKNKNDLNGSNNPRTKIAKEEPKAADKARSNGNNSGSRFKK